MRKASSSLWSITARLSRNTTLLLALVTTLAAAESTPFISDADWSQPKVTTTVANDAAPASPAKALSTMALALVAILGLGGGALVLVKRIGSRRKPGGTLRHVSLVETLPLSSKRSVALLRLGDQVVLIGSHEQGMTSLGTFSASALSAGDERRAATEASAPAQPPVTPSSTGVAFAAVLENLVGRSR
jgi:flagellar biogenesis protein FliO